MPSVKKTYTNRDDFLNTAGVIIFTQDNLKGQQLRYDYGDYHGLNLNNISCIIFPATTITFYNDNLDEKDKLLATVNSGDTFTVVNNYINNKCNNNFCNITRISVQKIEPSIPNRIKLLKNLGALYFPNKNFKGKVVLLNTGITSIPESKDFSLISLPNTKIELLNNKITTGLSFLSNDNLFLVLDDTNSRKIKLDSISISFLDPSLKEYTIESFGNLNFLDETLIYGCSEIDWNSVIIIVLIIGLLWLSLKNIFRK